VVVFINSQLSFAATIRPFVSCPVLLLLLVALIAIVATMTWCEKHHRALFVIIHDKALPVTINVLYQVFSPYADIEKIVRFQTRGDFHCLSKVLLLPGCCPCFLQISRSLDLQRLL